MSILRSAESGSRGSGGGKEALERGVGDLLFVLVLEPADFAGVFGARLDVLVEVEVFFLVEVVFLVLPVVVVRAIAILSLSISTQIIACSSKALERRGEIQPKIRETSAFFACGNGQR